jgi:hypothetical protein
MPASLPATAAGARPASTAALLGAGVLAACLGGCGPSVDTFAPACPQSGILPDAGDLVRYDSKGRDLVDLQLDARIVGVDGQCKPGETRSQLAAQLSVVIDLTRGPAAPSAEADFEYFVAVMKGDQILDKQVYQASSLFPDNVNRVRYTSEAINLIIPTPRGTSGAAYSVYVGFQLTEAELENNRRRRASGK